MKQCERCRGFGYLGSSHYDRPNQWRVCPDCNLSGVIPWGDWRPYEQVKKDEHAE